MAVLPSVGTLKRTALASLKRSGCTGLVGTSRWRRQRLLILAYHGISQDDEHRWDPALYMSPEEFEQRLWLIRSAGCTVLRLGEAVERLYAGRLDERSVVVTFDDGYCDFVTRAHPLLEKYHVPATLYLPTFRLGLNTPVFPLACSYLFWKSKLRRVDIPELRSQPFDISDRTARATTVAEIHRTVKQKEIRGAERDALVEAIANRLALDYAELVHKRLFQVMTADDVTRLSAAGVDIQLHTHTHNTPTQREAFEHEIRTNRDHIERLTGVRPSHFCYPSGNYDERFLPWLKDLAVVSATTCDPGLASRATPRLMLPRFVDTSNRSPVEFDGWLTGTAALLSRRASYAAPVA